MPYGTLSPNGTIEQSIEINFKKPDQIDWPKSIFRLRYIRVLRQDWNQTDRKISRLLEGEEAEN